LPPQISSTSMPKPDSRAKRPRKEEIGSGSSSREKATAKSPTTSGLAASDTLYQRSQLQSSQHSASSAPGPVSGNRPGQQAISSSGLAPPLGKVAIPALRSTHSVESTSKSLKKGRTAHACNNCRKTKAGCTGETPCPRCRNAGIPCQYGDGKREAEKKCESIYAA
jgi:hypothetical protein